MTSCENIRGQLLAHHHGELSPDGRRVVEVHLRSCAVCAREAALIREALGRAQALPVPEPPAGFWQGFEAAVHRRIVAEAPPRRPRWAKMADWLHGLFPLRPVPVLAAATALGLLLAIGLIRTQRPPRDLPPADVLAFSEDLAIGQNLELLESLDLLEDIEVLERLDLLRDLDGAHRRRLS